MVLFCGIVFVATAFFGCNPSKNNAATRNYQAFLTRYNIEYNGDKYYRETLEDLENSYEDDHSSLLPVHPADSRGDEEYPQPIGDFTRSIEKAQKAIELHSIKKTPGGKAISKAEREWRRRSEYNPYLHNSWMLMAKSQYMNGNFRDAASLFLYIIHHFNWLPQTVQEAKIWEARCYSAMGWLYEGLDILSTVNLDEIKSREVKYQYWATKSSLLIKQGEYVEACEALNLAVSLSKGHQKTRLRYLLGQLYVIIGERLKAYEIFKKIAGNITNSHLVRLSARLAAAHVTPPQYIEKELKSLYRATTFGSNTNVLDKIYNAIGSLCLEEGDTASALMAYRNAIDKSVHIGRDYGMAQLSIGKIYFDQGKYSKAANAYSEAIGLLPRTFEGYDKILWTSIVLNKIEGWSSMIERNDSLLRISYLPELEQLAVCQKLAREYRRLARSNTSMEKSFNNTLSDLMIPQPSKLNSNDEWYFYNPTLVNAGRSIFSQIWGDRRLEDDWRRADKTPFYFSLSEEDLGIYENEEDEGNVSGNESKEIDQGDVEYYMRGIPNTPEERNKLEEDIEYGMYNIALLLKNDLKNFKAATSEFESLLKRFPGSGYTEDVYHNLFLMACQNNDDSLAEHYRNLIVTEFPQSKLGLEMSKRNYIAYLKHSRELIDSMYIKAYQSYLSNDWTRVDSIYNEFISLYPNNELAPKFIFLAALSEAAQGHVEKFRATINALVNDYPGSDVTPVASDMLGLLDNGKIPMMGKTNLTDIRYNKISNERDEPLGDDLNLEKTEPVFLFESHAPQIVLIIYPNKKEIANKVLFEVASHNFSTFSARDFDLIQNVIDTSGVLEIEGFNNLNEAENYIGRLPLKQIIEINSEIIIVAISFTDFHKMISDNIPIERYIKDLNSIRYREAQELVLDPTVYSIEEL
ncbi:MAG: tetratricopeptide repeat protein [Muribaculaceae bacterium]|nr:tetratricopeptide repeat protein [Muribaculaceae bacterium]